MLSRFVIQGLSAAAPSDVQRSSEVSMSLSVSEIQKLSMFRGIRPEDLPVMLECLKGYEKTFRKNENISIEQENIRNVGVIISGTVDMIKEDIWGNTTMLVRLGRDRIFGETFACGSDSRAAVIFRASRDARILFMPFQRVMRTCSHSCVFHHQLIENMVEQIADKNRELMQKVEAISQKTLRTKILTYLSAEAQKQGKRYFQIPLGRQEMADYLCADRSAVSRELSEMKKEGLIDFDRDVFNIL